MNCDKYRSIPTVDLPDRKWPSAKITKAPVWCSVDLRDGNQALEVPMTLDQKVEFFKFLCETGFKEIEIGFPAASETDFNFCRYLIDNNIIPEDVAIQVLTQSRPHIIEKTMEAVKGAGKVIIHLYNSTSTLQRDVVFGFSCEECIKLAVEGAEMIAERINADNSDTEFIFEYSPESFSSTEPEFAVKICDAVMDVIKPSPDKKAIVNLPETVEYQTANVYADQVEYFCTNTRWRDSILVSLHTHNDRGTAVATSEFGLMAGADRVEGTLFGHGERTGNVDIITLAINMLMTGVDPELDFSDMNNTIDVYEDCTGMKVEPRHPWAGKLVFTAFSGSHQDAINKGVKAMKERKSEIWQVPYLPIDPSDIGREYEPIVRINSQSGKGGVAFIMDTYFGFKLPKGMHKEFAKVIQAITEKQGEISPDEIMAAFKESYIDMKEPLHFRKLKVDDQSDSSDSEFDTHIMLTYTEHDKEESFEAVGNGPIDAVLRGLKENLGLNIKVLDYEEHALQGGANAQAAAYIHLLNDEDGSVTYGVGVSSNITRASVRAMFSAINRLGLIK